MSTAQNFFKDYVIDGGITMYALIPLSIYTLALITQRSLDLRKSKVISNRIITLSQSVKDIDTFASFKQAIDQDDSVLSKVIKHYILLNEKTADIGPSEDLTPIDDEAEMLYQDLTPISTSYVVAPLIGVLGTTVGIMETFKQFALSGKRDMASLVTAIDQSLITTMWGLAIAVPAYFFYSVLQRKIFEYERKILPKVAEEILVHIRPFIR